MRITAIIAAVTLLAMTAGATELTDRVRDANKDAKRIADKMVSTNAEAKVTLAQIRQDLQDVASALDAIDVSATGTLAVAISATSGATKTALTETRKTLQDFRASVRNLLQADRKLVARELAREGIQKAAANR